MTRVWNSIEEAHRAAETCDIIWHETGKLPSEYLASVRETLKVSRKGEVQEFYETLARLSPSALKLFTEGP